MTFRAGTPEMIVVGLLTALLALPAAAFALIIRGFDCAAEASSECSTIGLVQLLMAWGGVIPAAATLVESVRRRGHPWRWFCVTALVYAGWGVLLEVSISG